MTTSDFTGWKPYIVSYQLNYLNKDPVVGGGGHEFEEQGRQGKVVLGISSGQFTDDIHGRWLDTWDIQSNVQVERLKY